jgi:myo-inositol-1(or 4)-monophosphatase
MSPDPGAQISQTAERAVALCALVRETVLPFLGRHVARAHAGAAVGGDVTFDIDERAEAVLEEYMAAALPEWAYYSEDRGLHGAADPEIILVVDPIDGTRPAAAGLETACVSIAAVPGGIREPTMGDVVVGVLQELKSGDLFVAERGAGLRMCRATVYGTSPTVLPGRALGGDEIPLCPSPGTDIETLFWTIGFRGRPAVVLATVLGELIDASSVGGGVFDIGSATYSITRVLTGQLDAYVHIGPAIIDAHPAVAAEFRRVGRGAVLNNSPYDLAAVHLMCREAGLPITDAAGRALDNRLLLGSHHEFQMACIASGNDELQRRLVEVVQRGIEALVWPPAGGA